MRSRARVAMLIAGIIFALMWPLSFLRGFHVGFEGTGLGYQLDIACGNLYLTQTDFTFVARRWFYLAAPEVPRFASRDQSPWMIHYFTAQHYYFDGKRFMPINPQTLVVPFWWPTTLAAVLMFVLRPRSRHQKGFPVSPVGSSDAAAAGG